MNWTLIIQKYHVNFLEDYQKKTSVNIKNLQQQSESEITRVSHEGWGCYF